MRKLLVTNVVFEPDAVVFQFMRQGDMREPGLALTQQLRVPNEEEFEALLFELDQTAERVLRECLREFEESPAYGTEEEAPSPYDNPEDR